MLMHCPPANQKARFIMAGILFSERTSVAAFVDGFADWKKRFERIYGKSEGMNEKWMTRKNYEIVTMTDDESHGYVNSVNISFLSFMCIYFVYYFLYNTVICSHR